MILSRSALGRSVSLSATLRPRASRAILTGRSATRPSHRSDVLVGVRHRLVPGLSESWQRTRPASALVVISLMAKTPSLSCRLSACWGTLPESICVSRATLLYEDDEPAHAVHIVPEWRRCRQSSLAGAFLSASPIFATKSAVRNGLRRMTSELVCATTSAVLAKPVTNRIGKPGRLTRPRRQLRYRSSRA